MDVIQSWELSCNPLYKKTVQNGLRAFECSTCAETNTHMLPSEAAKSNTILDIALPAIPK